MTQETQQRILALISRVSTETSDALGYEGFSFEEALGFLRAHGNKSLFEVMLEICKRAVPGLPEEALLTPEDIRLALAVFDTREEAEALLLRLPEPDPIKLDRILSETAGALPVIRRVLAAFTKRVIDPPDEEPRALGPEKDQDLRNELSVLSAERVCQPDTQRQMADRKPVRVSVIYQIRMTGTEARE